MSENIPKKSLSRRTKRRIISWTVTLLVVAAVFISNIIAMTLTNKFSFMTADITERSNFELTEQSIEIANSISKKVTITFLMSRTSYENNDTYCKQTSEIARRLAQNSDGMISVEYIDLVQNPTYESNFPNENLSTTSVIVQCGDKYDILSKYDLFNFETYNLQYEYVTSSKAEKAIDSALLTLTRDSVENILIVNDNCTKDYSYLETVLKNNSYNVTEISLSANDIPENTDFIIAYAPTKDYSESIISKLENYLKNDEKYGKTLLYVPFGESTNTPNIDSMLREFGMRVENGLAFDMNTGRITGNSYYDGLVSFYNSDKFTEGIDENDSPVMISRAKPITFLNEINKESLITLSAQSGYCPFDADSETWSMIDSVTGNVKVVAQASIGNDEASSSLIIAGSTYMFESSHMNTLFGNEEYLLNIVGDSTGRAKNELKISEKVIDEFDLTISSQTAIVVGILVFAVFPLMILGAGFCVFLIRRRK